MRPVAMTPAQLLAALSTLLFAAATTATATAQSLPPPTGVPAADPAAVVTAGNARFTVLTEHLVRLEYTPPASTSTHGRATAVASDDGATWEDSPTMAIWNRHLPVPQFTHTVDPTSGTVTIATAALTLTYAAGTVPSQSPPLTASTLTINMKEPNLANETTWHPGMSSAGNLFGTFHNLDRMNGWQDMNCSHAVNGMTPASPYAHWWCAMGVLSTHGWAVIDDSRSPVFGASTPAGNWPQAQTRGECPAVNASSQTPAPTPTPASARENGTRSAIVTSPGDDAMARVPCFHEPNTPFNQPFRQGTCQAAGCCWDPKSPWGGDVVPLIQWFNGNDNVLSIASMPPSNATSHYHSDLGIVGYALTKPAPDAPSNELQLWYRAKKTGDGETVDEDHWTTATAPGAAAAKAAGYTLLGSLGYLPATATRTATVPVEQWFSASRDDHFASLNNCQGCIGYMYTDQGRLGYALSASAVPPCFQRSGNQDLYFFGHGVGEANYAGALGDLASISGAIPIPRRHALGISWSRWAQPGKGWSGNQSAMIAAVNGLRDAQFPLDTFIFDMNWHEKPDWTGYTWDASDTWYPDHVSLLAFLHARGLYTGANLHDAQGVMPFEKRYAAMAKAVGQSVSANQTVLFHISNQTYADALSVQVLQPLADEGLDFWWTDWQQQLAGGSPPQIGTLDMSGLNPTSILNHYRFHNYSSATSDRRGLIHSRYGGLGGHRYPTQFGGDVVQSWESLSFFAYHVSTAANVLTGYWAEELMGPTGLHQLFTRVLQFGSWGPVFTTWGNPSEPNNLWEDSDLPRAFREAARTPMLHRAMTIPYRYTLARIAHDTGVSIVRPAYYHYPWQTNAYANATAHQFFVGRDVLVSPVYRPLPCTPTANCSSGESTQAVWLPPDATWVPAFNNTPPLLTPNVHRPSSRLTAHQTPGAGRGLARSDGAMPVSQPDGEFVNVSSAMAEVPVYVRAGAVIPMLVDANAVVHGSASCAFDPLVFTVYDPAAAGGGSGRGGTWVYEDDGLSNDYLHAAAFVNITMTFDAAVHSSHGDAACAGGVTYNATSTGTYPGAPSSRQYMLHVVNPDTGGGDGDRSGVASAPAATVWHNGVRLPQAAAAGVECTPSALPAGQWCEVITTVVAGDRAASLSSPERVTMARRELVVALPRGAAGEAHSVTVCPVME